jgi:hypothetical protein
MEYPAAVDCRAGTLRDHCPALNRVPELDLKFIRR